MNRDRCRPGLHDEPLLTLSRKRRIPADPELLHLPLDHWRLLTDAVMGGVSAGRVQRETRDGRACLHRVGQVRTERNGGFIQVTLDIDPRP